MKSCINFAVRANIFYFYLWTLV